MKLSHPKQIKYLYNWASNTPPSLGDTYMNYLKQHLVVRAVEPAPISIVLGDKPLAKYIVELHPDHKCHPYIGDTDLFPIKERRDFDKFSGELELSADDGIIGFGEVKGINKSWVFSGKIINNKLEYRIFTGPKVERRAYFYHAENTYEATCSYDIWNLPWEELKIYL